MQQGDYKRKPWATQVAARYGGIARLVMAGIAKTRDVHVYEEF